MRHEMLFGLGVVAAGVLTAGAGAGVPVCGPFTTDLLTGYQQGGDPALRGTQDTDSGWTYRQGSAAGPLLTAISAGGGYLAGYWGSPALLFSIPTGGPVYSGDSLLNQVTFFRRPPSFTGVYLHPGATDATNGCATLTVQAPIVVTGLSGQAESCGNFDGIQARVVKRVAGVESEIVPFTFAGPNPAPAVTLTPAGGTVPFVLNPGDSVSVQTNRFGSEFEDWANVNLSITFTGGPLIPAPASAKVACFGSSATIGVQAIGSSLSYVWRRNGVPIPPGPGRYSGMNTPSLQITGLIKADLQDRFDCLVTSACTGATVRSGEGLISSLLPDVNADGQINTADLVLLLNQFGQAVSPLDPVDVNSDGQVNTTDLVGFLAAFGRPCP